MGLYTRTGDDGTTGLFGGERVGKDHPRVEAYGTVDELNAWLGLAAAGCDESRAMHTRFAAILGSLQSRLFDLGADLATPPDSPSADRVVRMTDADVAQAEAWIDEIDGANADLKTFVLPGGSELAARLHVARGVARRAERAVVTLDRDEDVTPAAVVYLNRIGDLLFAMARRANGLAGVPDVPWTARRPGDDTGGD